MVTPQPDGATQGLEEYAQLKQQLFKRAQRAGGFLSAYLLLQQGSVVSTTLLHYKHSSLKGVCKEATDQGSCLQAAACSGLGCAVGYLYLKALVAAVDKYDGDTEVPLDRAREYQGPFRALVIGFTAYRSHSQPQSHHMSQTVPHMQGVFIRECCAGKHLPLAYCCHAA